MESWLQLAPKKNSQEMIHPFIQFTVREIEIELDQAISKQYSILTQFMIGLALQDRDGVMSLYIGEDGVSNKIIREVLLHFDRRQGVYIGGKLAEIVLSKPNRDSEMSVRLRKLNPIIDELFLFSDKKVQETWRPVKRYKVLPGYIDRYDDEEMDKVLHFLKQTAKNNIRLLSIKKWKVTAHLKKYVALQYLVHHCENVYLWVDDVGETSLIELEMV